jgi:hypothetical protein
MKTDLFVYEEAPKSNKKRYYKEFAWNLKPKA